MAASSSGFTAHLGFKLSRFSSSPFHAYSHGLDSRKKKRRLFPDGNGVRVSRINCCCSDSVVRRASGSGNSVEKPEEKRSHRSRFQAIPALPFPSHQSRFGTKQEKFYPRCTPRNTGPQSRDTPPKRDTGIANEKDMGINLLKENVSETGTNEDGSTWFRESGEDLGANGYRCRWTKMGGRSHDDSTQWEETWWEKSDWTGYKELGVEKSGRNAEGDSWWETWQEMLHQDEWSNLARIERSAQKQAKSGTENAGWYEKWWEKYDAKGWTEKGANKYGRLNEQSWWEKWGEHYDGRGSVTKWTDKWAETELGTKWGDKWEEKFFAGIGSRHGETWHVSPIGGRMCLLMLYVGQGPGERNILETGKFTNTEKARQVKAGILLWTKKPIMRLNLIMDGLMSWVIQASYYQSNPGKGHQVSTQISTSGHLLHLQSMTCQTRLSLPHNEDLIFQVPYFVLGVFIFIPSESNQSYLFKTSHERVL